ncbi:MAG TPA: hypothetical protein VGX24_10200 [Pyrinomonadaceae bacterium]|nr:hypothetical protein [Pyrinomonadaceae bacterium]
MSGSTGGASDGATDETARVVFNISTSPVNTRNVAGRKNRVPPSTSTVISRADEARSVRAHETAETKRAMKNASSKYESFR